MMKKFGLMAITIAGFAFAAVGCASQEPNQTPETTTAPEVQAPTADNSSTTQTSPTSQVDSSTTETAPAQVGTSTSAQ
ncbi:MAG: hypothetical protein QM666_10605 [Acinetobacter sp.]